MKKEKIICKLKESYKYKKKYWVISGIVVFSAIFCITVVKPPKFIKDSKLYIQSLIDGDPSYEKLKEKVSLYVYKKEISLKEFEEGTIVKKEDEVKVQLQLLLLKVDLMASHHQKFQKMIRLQKLPLTVIILQIMVVVLIVTM